MSSRFFISPGNASDCTILTISISAFCSSSTDNNELAETLSLPSLSGFQFIDSSFFVTAFSLKLFLYLRQIATAAFAVFKFEKRSSLLSISFFSVTTFAFTLTFTSGSAGSTLLLMISSVCQVSSESFKNSGPFNKPLGRHATHPSSAGFSAEFTYLH